MQGMTESNTDFYSLLNSLIQTSKDGQEGFLTAAQNVGDFDLKEFFNEVSLQRAKFAGELQTEAHLLGNTNPEYASSVSGTLHRGWMNIQAVVTGRDRHSILSSCEEGEDAAIRAYKTALAELERQLAEINSVHLRVRTLREEAAAAPKE
jgi:uncharacterized protein (TIGR02284 family)